MKVLIVSHNPVCTYNNMGKTLLSLFCDFSKDELCQLYVYPSFPDVDACRSYYRITDSEILHGFGVKKVKGKIISPFSGENKVFDSDVGAYFYKSKRNHGPVFSMLRDLMWRCSRWFGNDLKKWLENEKPTHIFLAPGTSTFIYKIAFTIADYCKIPVTTYYADDYYFVMPPISVLAKINSFRVRAAIKKYSVMSEQLIVISEGMRQLYEKMSSRNTTVIMTGVSSQMCIEQTPHCINASELTYMGNLDCQRYKTLELMGRAITKINKKMNTRFQINVYTNEQDPSILDLLRSTGSVVVRGFVTGDCYWKTFNSANAFIHVEAFDIKSIDRVKNSISTKIPDCLASGKPFLAVGPEAVASIKYLRENGCAYVISDTSRLEEELQKFLFEKDIQKQIAEKALITVKRNHVSEKNSNVLRNLLIQETMVNSK